jgi:uncharacterized membrane protein
MSATQSVLRFAVFAICLFLLFDIPVSRYWIAGPLLVMWFAVRSEILSTISEALREAARLLRAEREKES